MAVRKRCRIKRGFLIVLLCLLGFPGGVAYARWVNIGVLARRGRAECLKKWTPTAVYLSRQIPGVAFKILPLPFDQILPSVKKGCCDFILTNPALYVECAFEGGVERIATVENVFSGHTYTHYGGAVICRSNRRDIRHLKDLKGCVFAAPAPTCFGAWIAVCRELKEKGINPRRDFKKILFVGTLDAVVDALMKGKADAGSIRTDVLVRVARERNIPLKTFRVIGARPPTRAFPFPHTTRLYPDWPFAIVSHVPPALAKQVTIALLRMPRDSEAARVAGCAGWSIPQNYESVRGCLRTLRLGPYRNLGKVTLQSVIKRYGIYLILIMVLLLALSGGMAIFIRLNRRLKRAMEERERSERTLREKDELYRAIVTHSHSGILIVGDDYKLVEVNEQVGRIFGRSTNEIVGRDFRELLDEDARELVEKNYRRRIRGEDAPSRYEFKIVRKDGARRIVELNAALVKDSRDRRWIIGQLLDITERKKALENLRRSEEKLRRVFQVSPLGIGLIQGRRMVWHNEAISRMLGYAPEELQGKDARMLYASDKEYQRVGEVIQSLRHKKRSAEVETRWVRKDGSVFDCHIRYAMMDPEADDSPVLYIAEDITQRKEAEKERKRLQEQVYRAQKMEAIGLLAGGVAHDFNNILTAIMGNAELALLNLERDRRAASQNIEEILKAGQRASALTRQLLAFSRKELIRPEVLDMNGVVRDLEKMLRRLIGEDIELLMFYAPDLRKVKIDPGQLEQILLNLTVNARDAMPKGGQLIIETANADLDEIYFREHGVEERPGAYVRLSVSDTGIGMDPEIQKRIFDPFFTTKEKGQGTGLGLSTVYGIVKQNGGFIWAYSEKGKGTTFKVYFPSVGEEIALKSEEKSQDALPGGTETLLVVEDDPALRKIIREILQERGYTVWTARSGKEALEYVQSQKGAFDLLLTDVVMPGMTGKELAEVMKVKIPGVKILYMSGYTGEIIAQHGILEKDVFFIQKPFTKEELTRKVRDLLDR